MKHLKRAVAVFLVVAVFLGSFFGGRALFREGEFGFDPHNLSIFDSDGDCYYLSRAAADIIFRIGTYDNESAEFSLSDSQGNPVVAGSEKTGAGKYNILPPAGGYEKGERYTLALSGNAFFRDDNLKNARKIVFAIERDPIERYVYREEVAETEEKITEIDDETIECAALNVKNGDIVIGKDGGGGYAVYKIDELLDGGARARVSVPALEEIYSELDVYGEYEWDVDELTANPELEIEIIENVRRSEFFDSLMLSAYAADDRPEDAELSVSVTPDSADNSVTIQIKITLKPGEKGLFGDSRLKNQQVKLTLTSKLGLKTNCNIKGITDWDLSASLTSGFSWTVDVSLYTKEWKNEKDLKDLFSDKVEYASYDDYYLNKQYQSSIRKITDALDRLSADVTGGELKLFDWKLPIPSVPGLYFSTEIKLFTKLELAADLVIGQSNETVYTVGVCFTNNRFEAYSNQYRGSRDVTLSLRGRAKAKAGVKLVFKATLICDELANINLDPQVGLYAEVYATMPIAGGAGLDKRQFIYSYFEPGVYFSCNINATLNLLFGKCDFSHELTEQEFPIEAMTFGDRKIAIGISPGVTTARAIDNRFTVPDILLEYYDVKKGAKATERIESGKLKFTAADGTALKASDGKITLPQTASGNCYVSAAYTHANGRAYSTLFCVLISGSMLEGKVSAYNPDLSSGALPGARVELFSASNSVTPLSTALTDENGRFAFNVSKGNYTLRISADGYRTLTSRQTVDADEIKYTEHILLIDSGQSGTGSAGGTVSNALDGRGLGGVRLRFRENWNSTDGACCDFETVTDPSGRFSLTDVPVGYYTAEASLAGYVTGYMNLIVTARDARDDFDFTLSPELNESEVRVVLTWGETPEDLDSHLIGPTPSGGAFNVFYGDKQYYYNGVEMANLDVDDVTSYGPETVTILEDIFGTYTYAVHDYTNRGSSASDKLSYSGAMVRVFTGSVQVAEYHVPTGQIGTYWTVFRIDSSGSITPVNTLSNTRPST